MSKYDWIEDLRPETPIVVAVREMGKVVVDALASWPPEVAWTDASFKRRYGSLFDNGAPRPAWAAFDEAVKRLKMEFDRDYEALDFYARNHHLQQACPLASDQLASDFVFFYVSEAYLVLIERTHQQVRRADVLAGLDEFAARMRAAWSPVIH